VVADQIKEFTLRLPAEDHRALKVHCALTGESMNGIVARLIHEYLAGPGREASFAAALAETRTEYRVALDKLAE